MTQRSACSGAARRLRLAQGAYFMARKVQQQGGAEHPRWAGANSPAQSRRANHARHAQRTQRARQQHAAASRLPPWPRPRGYCSAPRSPAPRATAPRCTPAAAAAGPSCSPGYGSPPRSNCTGAGRWMGAGGREGGCWVMERRASKAGLKHAPLRARCKRTCVHRDSQASSRWGRRQGCLSLDRPGLPSTSALAPTPPARPPGVGTEVGCGRAGHLSNFPTERSAR